MKKNSKCKGAERRDSMAECIAEDISKDLTERKPRDYFACTSVPDE